MLALGCATAGAAAAAVAALDGAAYRSFNMVIVDRDAVWFVRNLGDGRPEARLLPPGLHMVTAHDPDDLSSPRVARHLPRFAAATVPEPPDWGEWERLLGDTSGAVGEALAVPETAEFGTVSASLLGLPENGSAVWRFARGIAGSTPTDPVTMP